MRGLFSCLTSLCFCVIGCSSSSSTRSPTIYGAGDKAPVGRLTYSVTDTEISQQLGADTTAPRAAQQRFYLVKISVSNSGTEEESIPGMNLVDDAGQSFPELADGTGVEHWLGVVRKVGPAQTEQGYVLFDVSTKHYRLRVNDPLDDKEIAIDIPLTFAHERLKDLQSSRTALPDAPELKK
jgi:hypothetical protein